MKQRILSGIQPSGIVHIGNYFGAIENWTRLLDQYECIFAIVDLHAITIEYDAEGMQERIFQTAVSNIAAGLDPDKCSIVVQSHVPGHTELNWLLNAVAPLGDLERMTQFKEKSQQHRHNLNAGLLNYPILQAADILIYNADAVPVGEDQEQHLEFTRELARRFNRRFGEYFKEPKTLVGRGARVVGLDGQSKMSKSLNNHIGLLEPKDAIWEKLAPAVTDTARVRRKDPGNPEICNIFSLHKLVTDDAGRQEIAQGCRTAGIGCFDCKKVLLENLDAVLNPIREKAETLRKDPGTVWDILEAGRKKCSALAERTLSDVKERMGLLKPT